MTSLGHWQSGTLAWTLHSEPHAGQAHWPIGGSADVAGLIQGIHTACGADVGRNAIVLSVVEGERCAG
jgi:hypothetical protein